MTLTKYNFDSTKQTAYCEIQFILICVPLQGQARDTPLSAVKSEVIACSELLNELNETNLKCLATFLDNYVLVEWLKQSVQGIQF